MKYLIVQFLLVLICFQAFAQNDVDTKIPVNDSIISDMFVLIIANEHYKYEQEVPFAINDGETFCLYCENTLGIPSKNIHFSEDATLNDMRMQVRWLKKIMEAFDGEARAIVYYSGHGMPDDEGKQSYLLPVDGHSTLPESGFSTSELYKQLGQMPSKGTVVFLDACFSGTRRDGQMLTMSRGVAIKAKPQALTGNVAVLSAAQGNETALSYTEMHHGLFTYYLLKHLQEKGGYTNLSELNDYVTQQVRRMSILENDKDQTPSIAVSSTCTNWKDWPFAKVMAKRYEIIERKVSNKDVDKNNIYNKQENKVAENNKIPKNKEMTKKDEALKFFVDKFCSLYGIKLNETKMSDISDRYGVKQKEDDEDSRITLKDFTDFTDKGQNGIVHMVTFHPQEIKKENPIEGLNWKSSYNDWNEWFTSKGFDKQIYEPYYARQSMLVYVNDEFEVILMFDGGERKKGTWFSLIIAKKYR